MLDLTVQTVVGRLPLRIADDASVAQLRAAVAAAAGLAIDTTRLVSGGRVLADSDASPALLDGASSAPTGRAGL